MGGSSAIRSRTFHKKNVTNHGVLMSAEYRSAGVQYSYICARLIEMKWFGCLCHVTKDLIQPCFER